MNCPYCHTNTEQPKTRARSLNDKVYVVWTCKHCGKHLMSSYIDGLNLKHHIKHYGQK